MIIHAAFKLANKCKMKSPAVLPYHVASLSTQPCSLNLDQSSLSRPNSGIHDWHQRWVWPAWLEPIKSSMEGYRILLNNGRHLAIKQMLCNIGVSSIGKIANDLPKTGRAIDYKAAAPWPPLGSPERSQLLYKRLKH
jgi:hypothetical protein